jgi:O-antigen/teichoic acid export membrane protein
MINSLMNGAAGMMQLTAGFLSAIVIARLLGAEAIGVVAFALWLVTTASQIAELGTGVTLLQILPQLKVKGFNAERRRGFAALLLHPVMAATVLLAAAYAAACWEADNLHWVRTAPSVVLLTGILMFIQSIGSYSKTYFIGEQDLGSFSRVTAATSAIQVVGVALGAYLIGLEGALLGFIAGQIIPFLVGLRISVTRRDSCDISGGYLVSSSAVLILEFIVSAVFLSRPELFFLQQFAGVKAVGFYAVALSLSNIALQLPIQLSGSLLPFYAEKRQHADGPVPLHVFEGVVRNFSYITLPMCFGLMAISGPLVISLYGDSFRPSCEIVAALLFGAPLFVFLQVCTLYLFSMDRAKARLRIAVIGSVIMVIGSVAVIPLWGGMGAAVVRDVVFAAMVILMLREMRLGRLSREMYVTVTRVSASAASCALAAWYVSSAIGGISGISLAVVAGAIVYFISLRLLRAVSREDAELLQRLTGNFPGAAGMVSGRILRLIVPHVALRLPSE